VDREAIEREVGEFLNRRTPPSQPPDLTPERPLVAERPLSEQVYNSPQRTELLRRALGSSEHPRAPSIGQPQAAPAVPPRAEPPLSAPRLAPEAAEPPPASNPRTALRERLLRPQIPR
jgi:hypothetical protein